MELVRRQVMDRGGYLAENDQAKLIAAGFPLTQLLVKCESCRFGCSVQDSEHIISAVEDAGDFVRSVELVAPALDAWRQELNQVDADRLAAAE